MSEYINTASYKRFGQVFFTTGSVLSLQTSKCVKHFSYYKYKHFNVSGKSWELLGLLGKHDNRTIGRPKQPERQVQLRQTDKNRLKGR
jgi:hypothetical protein